MTQPAVQAPLRIAIVGPGKIARDSHVPAIAANPAIDLVATAGGPTGIDGIPHHQDLAALLTSGIAIDAVTLATPPGPRPGLARAAMAAGLDVLLEKPPAATMGEAEALVPLPGRVLFASWHSRFAPGVAPALAALAGQRPTSIEVTWVEDVRRWHPGQAWIWEPEGMGVFDPGINALSIVTLLAGQLLSLDAASLAYPENRRAPIAARLALTGEAGVRASCEFDWRGSGPDIWRIAVTTAQGRQVVLNEGGHDLMIDGDRIALAGDGEYPALYRHFAALVAARQSDVDLAPLRLAAAALGRGNRQTVAPFHD